MNQDPVQQIKDEEAKVSQKIQDSNQKNSQSLDDHKIEKEKELTEHKEALRSKGQESLESAKQSAMGEFKKIIEDEDRNRSTLIGNASSKKDEAIKYIVSTFEKHLS